MEDKIEISQHWSSNGIITYKVLHKGISKYFLVMDDLMEYVSKL